MFCCVRTIVTIDCPALDFFLCCPSPSAGILLDKNEWRIRQDIEAKGLSEDILLDRNQ